MELDLDALERIAQAATPGPWEAGEIVIWGDGNDIPQAAVLVSGSPLTWDDHGGEVFDPVNAEHIAAFDPPTALALIARLREAEREMHARELHHFEEEKLRAEAEVERDRYWEAIKEIRAMLPGPRTFAESLARDFEGNLWPRTIDADRVSETLTRALNDKEAEK